MRWFCIILIHISHKNPGGEVVTDKILIVEDDKNIAQLLTLYIEKWGYETRICGSGSHALEVFPEFAPDLVLLDIMLPVLNGWDVLAEIRRTSKIPVIMITARGDTEDKVKGLEMGADDYIAKPFEMKEVMARINAVMRRYKDAPGADKRLVFDGLCIDLNAYELIVGGTHQDAPPKEIELLHFLASSPNKVFTRDQLLDQVWGYDYFGDSRTVDVHIKRLREKLDKKSDCWNLKTVWGVGYKFETR